MSRPLDSFEERGKNAGSGPRARDFGVAFSWALSIPGDVRLKNPGSRGPAPSVQKDLREDT